MSINVESSVQIGANFNFMTTIIKKTGVILILVLALLASGTISKVSADVQGSLSIAKTLEVDVGEGEEEGDSDTNDAQSHLSFSLLCDYN